MKFSIPGPLDLSATLESGQAHRWQKDGQWYCGVVSNYLLKIRQISTGLEIQSYPKDAQKLKSILRNYFRLSDNMDEIYKVINTDPLMSDIIARYHGLRLLRQQPWECLVAFICSATSNLSRIASNMESISEAFGFPLTLEEHTRYTFPSPSALAIAGEGALRDLGLGFRARYLHNAAKIVAEGRLDLEGLREMSYTEAKSRLTELLGVGDKIADCVLVFSLDKMEAFPIDRWIRRAIEDWYLKGQRMSYSYIHQWAQDYFGPYAGYAQQYLFHGRRLEGMISYTIDT